MASSDFVSETIQPDLSRYSPSPADPVSLRSRSISRPIRGWGGGDLAVALRPLEIGDVRSMAFLLKPSNIEKHALAMASFVVVDASYD